MASIKVDGKAVEVPEGYSVREALETLGFEITMFLLILDSLCPAKREDAGHVQ